MFFHWIINRRDKKSYTCSKRWQEGRCPWSHLSTTRFAQKLLHQCGHFRVHSYSRTSSALTGCCVPANMAPPNLSATWGMTRTLETRRRNGSYSGKTIKRAGEQQGTRSQHSQQDPGGHDDLYGSFPTWDNLWLSKLWEVSSAPCSLPGKQWCGVRASHPSRSTKRTASYGDREEELASCAIISSAVWHRKVFSKHSPAEATCSTPSCDAIQHCC